MTSLCATEIRSFVLRQKAKNGRLKPLRITIPTDLCAYFRRAEVWRSPRTDNPALAKLRETQWRAHMGTLFARLRREGPAMSRDQIAALVAEYLSSQVTEIEDRLAVPMEHAAREQREVNLREEVEHIDGCLHDGNLRDVEETARGLLPNADEQTLRVFARRILEVKREAIHAELGAMYGETLRVASSG